MESSKTKRKWGKMRPEVKRSKAKKRRKVMTTLILIWKMNWKNPKRSLIRKIQKRINGKKSREKLLLK